MTSKRSFFVAVAICALMMFSGATPSRAASDLMPFFTPPAGGGAYILGAGLVSVTNKYTDIKMVHEACTGTMDIVRRMQLRDQQNKPVFGVFGSVDATRASKGLGEYSGKAFADLRDVLFVNFTDIYLVVPANSPIKTWADVKGKKIGIGGPGSTVANTALFLFEQYGVKKTDFKPYYFVYKETVEGIQNGSLDGGVVAGGFPIAAYTELSIQHNVRIVPVDENIVKKVTAEHPYYYRNVVKAKAYKGIDQDTTIMGFYTNVWTTAKTPDALVYKFLKNVFDHKADYYAIHTTAKDMQVETAAKGSALPYHPGAEKFFKEIGALKK